MMTHDNQKGAPNYFPNSFGGPVDDERARKFTVKHNASAVTYIGTPQLPLKIILLNQLFSTINS